MSKRTTITRGELIAAAADLWSGADFDELLPFWDSNEYMRGLCELIGNAAGADDPENAKSEVWEEIRAAVEAEERRHKIAAIVREIAGDALTGEPSVIDLPDLTAMLFHAVERGMEAR